MRVSTFTFLIALPCLVVCLQGCAPDPRPPVGVPGGDSCATGRWIGITASGSCPEPAGGTTAGWSWGRLFAGADPTSVLGGYCLYQHRDANRGSELDRLVDAEDLERVDPDCADVVTAGEMMEALSPGLAEQFSVQAGAALLPAATGSAAGAVRLAVLDTSPPSEEPPYLGHFEHGASLATMAHQLTCQKDQEACAAHVTTRLALPLSSGGVYDAGGGYFGTKGQLAEAIYDELTGWIGAAAEDRLVLNLSLGWIPHPDELSGDLGTDAQSVYDILREVACRGVLTVAAVGNLGSGPNAQTGPLLPAAWRSEATPDEIQLADGTTRQCVDSDPTAPHPMLYATSAIDSRGLRLSNHRPGTESPHVAFGSHAVARYENEGEHLWTGILTGSSVSTVVVSVAAATAWHYDTSLSRHALMQRLYDVGDTLYEADLQPRPAELDESSAVRRVSLCRAVEATSGDATCLQDWSPTPPTLAYAPDGWPVHGGSIKTPVPAPDECPAASQYFSETPDPGAHLCCPFQKIAGFNGFANDAVYPQPEDIPCPSCPLIKNPDQGSGSGDGANVEPRLGCPGTVEEPYTLFIEIDEDYQGGLLTDATLRIDDRYYLLDVGFLLDVEETGLGTGSQLEVRCIEGQDIDPARSTADLTFAASEHGSVMNVIPISADG